MKGRSFRAAAEMEGGMGLSLTTAVPLQLALISTVEKQVMVEHF